jgi:hypothetical protein
MVILVGDIEKQEEEELLQISTSLVHLTYSTVLLLMALFISMTSTYGFATSYNTTTVQADDTRYISE